MSTEPVVNLDAIINAWALKQYKKDEKNISDLKNYDSKRLTKVPRYNDITFKLQGKTNFDKSENEDPQEDKKHVPKTLNKIVFRSTYNNPSGHPQTHTFKTERSATVNEKTSMTTGFKVGFQFRIQLGIPRVANTSLHVNPEVSFSDTTETSKTHALTWTSDITLPVPGHHTVDAEVVVTDEEFSTPFESDIAIKGVMRVDFVDPRDSSIVHTVRDEIASIIGMCQPLVDREDVRFPGNAVVLWTVKGKSYFQYDIQQTINTKYKDLKTDSPGPCDDD